MSKAFFAKIYTTHYRRAMIRYKYETGAIMKQQLPKHPLARTVKCPVCNVEFVTIPTRRGETPDNISHIIEQHVCPKGHVYTTEINSEQMLGTL